MIKVRLYEEGDAFKVNTHSYYPEGSKENVNARAKNQNSVFLTFLKDGEPIGVCGISPMMAHSAEVLMLISEELQKHPKFLHKFIKTELENTAKVNNLTRIQATTFANFEAGKRWLKRLGFEQEGLLRRFGANGQDYTIWSYLP